MDAGVQVILTDMEGAFRFPFSLTALVKKRRQILNWLSPERFNDTYDIFQLSRVETSGNWFLKLAEFQEWAKGASNLLIVTGMGIRHYGNANFDL